MAKIVLAACASHSPMLTLPAADWIYRAQSDYENDRLNLSDGRFLTYEKLLEETGAKYEKESEVSFLEAQEKNCQLALDRIADDIEKAAPDIVLIVGDDQEELFDGTNQPSICIYHGDEVKMSDRFGREEMPKWIRDMSPHYLMDALHTHPAEPNLAMKLIDGLMDRNFDISTSSNIQNPQQRGFGHAFGFMIKRLFKGKNYPVVPVLLNTYYPPNVPRPNRCFALGQAIAQIIEEIPEDLRIVIIASGGLSHFVTDEILDKNIIEAIKTGDKEALTSIPMDALNSGSSEILNWVVAVGAAQDLKHQWDVYEPIYRTKAGTGTGLGFAILK